METRTKREFQRLAIALRLTLKDGSPVVVGGEKCPNDLRIVQALEAAGWTVRRLTKAQRSDMRDDMGSDQRHVTSVDRLSATVREILDSPSGMVDAGGIITVEQALLLGM